MNLKKVATQATIAGALGFTALGLGFGVGTASADNGFDGQFGAQVGFDVPRPDLDVPRPDFDVPRIDFDVPQPDFDVPPPDLDVAPED
ncbi:MAG: hypothetical protein NVS4B6_06820 [Mycobacterium sp.]